MQKSFAEQTTQLQQQKTTPMALQSAKNKVLKQQFTQAHQQWTIEDWKNVA